MIRVPPVPEPAEWAEKGQKAGEAWLADRPAGERPKGFRPHPYWRAFASNLAAGFGERCGYTAMYVPNGTVDHFVPWEDVAGKPEETLAYAWSNLRYADGWINSSRKRTPFPDPYLVADDWFALSLPDLQLSATPNVPADQAARVANALRLLRNDDRVLRQRRKYFDHYRSGDMSLAMVDSFAPLLGRALRANPAYLRVGDGGLAP